MKKNEKGSVTGITVATILFIMIIMGTYLTTISSKRKAQLQETKLLQEIYGGDINEIYKEQLEKRTLQNSINSNEVQ